MHEGEHLFVFGWNFHLVQSSIETFSASKVVHYNLNFEVTCELAPKIPSVTQESIPSFHSLMNRYLTPMFSIH